MKLFLLENKRNILLVFIFIVLLIIPFFWTARIGGDDGRFYYLFPFEFLKNFATENIYNDLGSFNPPQYIIPFSFLLFLFKNIFFFLNIQNLFLGLNLACGFLFFYLFLGIFNENSSNDNNFLPKITASLFYSLSIFSYYTLWISQLFSMYLISIFPLITYLFFKSVREKKILYLILASLILSLFSILWLSISWLLALLIAILPITFQLFWHNKKIFIKYIFIFIFLFSLLNSYWLFNLLFSLHANNPTNNNVSGNFRQINNDLIKSVSSGNEIIYPLFNLFHKNIQIDYNWQTKEIYLNYLIKLLPLNLLFLIILIIPIFFYLPINKQIKIINRKDAEIHHLAFLSWLLIIFLYTTNIDKWGVPLFIFFTNNIPGFVIFRNMYDKFGVALSFSYALLLFISLKIIFRNLKIENVQKNIISLVLILLIIINAYPFLTGQFYKLPIWTTKDIYDRIDDFNDDFYKLVNYTSKLDTSSKFLWLPLNNAGYTIISDKYNNNFYYSGISPLKTLSDKNDYSGILNFNNYSSDIQKYIANKDYKNLFNLLGKFNIEYVILNKDISKDIQNSYLYSYLEKSDLYKNQMSFEFLSEILGEKIESFGNRYSLYKINDNYLSKIFDTNNIEFEKINNSQYRIYIKNITTESDLIFLSHYSKFWKLYLKRNPTNSWCANKNQYLIKNSNNKIIECSNSNKNSFIESLKYFYKKSVFSNTQKIVYGYANQWTINKDYIKKNFNKDYYKEYPDGSIDIEMTLHFKPQSYFYIGLMVSIATLLSCLIYLIWNFIKTKINNKKSYEEMV